MSTPEKPVQNAFNGVDDIEWLEQFQDYCETHIPEDELLQKFNKQIIKETSEKIKEVKQAAL